jgi:hypothetical protein
MYDMDEEWMEAALERNKRRGEDTNSMDAVTAYLIKMRPVVEFRSLISKLRGLCTSQHQSTPPTPISPPISPQSLRAQHTSHHSHLSPRQPHQAVSFISKIKVEQNNKGARMAKLVVHSTTWPGASNHKVMGSIP